MIWALVLPSWCAAFEGRLPAAAVEGRGGPSVAWVAEGDPADANPSLAAVSDHRLDLGGGMTRPLGLAGLGLGGLWARTPLRGGWAAAWRWKSLAAGEVYREDSWGGDLAWRAGRWAAGMGVRVGHVSLEGGSLGTPVGGAWGIRGEVGGGLALAASWEDASLWRSEGLAQPWVLGLGAAISGDDSSWAGDLSVEHRERTGWSGKVGQELRLEPLRLRAGLRAFPWSVSVGIGGGLRGARLDWALEGEPRLGWQHHLSCSWSY